MYALGCVLFAAALLFTILLTLPGETVLGMITPLLEARGIRLEAEKTRLTFPLGIRFENAAIFIKGEHYITLDEATASWELTSLFKRFPSHIRAVRGNAVADIRLSPVFWNPSRGQATLSYISSSDIALAAPPKSGISFFIRQAQMQWNRSGENISASGSMELDHLLLPINATDSPIREARIDNATLSFIIRENTFYIHRLHGNYSGARLEGTGEIARILSPNNITLTLHLTIINPFDGSVGTIFDMLSKNAKSVTLRITGTPAAPRTDFSFF